ncbi:MAG: nucleotide exchange factor GrpE [Defluviitaleaceae bacterium]|nr:nucleotide exchange factor GrpE [Defluviitaleaceae bacterium]
MPQPNFLTALAAYAPLKASIEPLTKEAYDQQLETFVKIFDDILYFSIRSWEPVKGYSETLYSKCKVMKYLTNVVIDTFISIIEYCREYEETLIDHQEEHQIIKAISETLVIKIENIKDALQSFLEETEEMTYNPQTLNIQDFALEQWDNIKDINLQLAEEFFVELQNDPKIQQKVAKSVNSHMQTLNKKEMAYKKDRLLFEITTFNDLLNYSIARLKESTEMDVLMYIQVVEEANSMINTTLINYGIRPINPPPHTTFNGREHEVIMTQSQEGFKKGEIIKVSNQGYHQSGVVIIRASVVVAR